MKLAIRTMIATAAALVLSAAVAIAPASAGTSAHSSAQATRDVAATAPLNPIPVSGTTSNGGTVTGTFTPTGFAHSGRNLVLNGVLNGTVRDASGSTQTFNTTTALPVRLPGTCPILHLTLGPLDLNLLGLTVHLDRVVLDISAISGPGNLLGNLLCAIAGLLDGTGGLSQLDALIAQLNQLLGMGG